MHEILVATDFSDEAEAAADEREGEARKDESDDARRTEVGVE